MAFTIDDFYDAIYEACEHREIVEYKRSEKRIEVSNAQDTTITKTVSCYYDSVKIAEIVLYVDEGSTVVYARKRIDGPLDKVHPFFLEYRIRKCLKKTLAFMRTRRKFIQQFEKMFDRGINDHAVEQRRNAVSCLISESIGHGSDRNDKIIAFIKYLLKWTGLDDRYGITKFEKQILPENK